MSILHDLRKKMDDLNKYLKITQKTDITMTMDKFIKIVKQGNIRKFPGIGIISEKKINEIIVKNIRVEGTSLSNCINKITYNNLVIDGSNEINDKLSSLDKRTLDLIISYVDWLNEITDIKRNKQKLFGHLLKIIETRPVNDDNISKQHLCDSNNTKITQVQKLVSQDPSYLEIIGLKFPEYDEIALNNCWWYENDILRKKKWIKYLCFEKCEENKATFITKDEFDTLIQDYKYINKCIKSKTSIQDTLDELIEDGYIIEEMNRLIPITRYNQENELSRILLDMLNNKSPSYRFELRFLPQGINISDEQRNAILGVLKNQISIILGKGGAGKTSTVLATIVNTIINSSMNNFICNDIDSIASTNLHNEIPSKKILLLAPTHQAKNQLKSDLKEFYEHIHFETLQSVIYQYQDKQNEIITCKLEKYLPDIQVIALDETSMADLESFYKLIKIINKSNIKLVLLGDDKQLPSIGVGNVFKDLIFSKMIPTFRLTKNFRAEGSDIQKFCNERLGDYAPSLKKPLEINKYKNVKMMLSEDCDEKQSLFIECNLKKILIHWRDLGYSPEGLGDDNKNLQVIGPTNKICKQFIPLIRKVFERPINIPAENNNNYLISSKHQYEMNDPVLMRSNTNHFKNGDTARILEVINIGSTIMGKKKYKIKLDTISYNIDNASDNVSEKKKKISKDSDGYYIINEEKGIFTVNEQLLKPALIRTVHSSQGNGWNIVISILDKGIGPNFTNKNLLYTLYSRAKTNLYLIGKLSAYNGKISRTYEYPRKTRLKLLLTNKLNSEINSDKLMINKIKLLNDSTKSRVNYWSKYYNQLGETKCQCGSTINFCDFKLNYKDNNSISGFKKDTIILQCITCYKKSIQ